jgi:hypothetical protein
MRGASNYFSKPLRALIRTGRGNGGVWGFINEMREEGQDIQMNLTTMIKWLKDKIPKFLN